MKEAVEVLAPHDHADLHHQLAARLAVVAVFFAAFDAVVAVRLAPALAVRCVEVDDASAAEPVIRPADPQRLGGMGMRIVNEVADAWGSSASASGKTVWFEVALR